MAKNILEKTDEEILEEKTSFVLYRNYYEDYCEGFNFEEMGKLFFCIMYYERFRKEPEYPDRTTELLFKKIKNNLDATDKDWLAEVKLRSLQGSHHKGNQYTRRKEKEAEIQRLAAEALEQNGTPFQLVPKNGTNGTDTVTDTDTVTVTVNSILSQNDKNKNNQNQPDKNKNNLNDNDNVNDNVNSIPIKLTLKNEEELDRIFA